MDLFGSLDYCPDADSIARDKSAVFKAIDDALCNSADIRRLLSQKMPLYKARAFEAGSILKQLIDEGRAPRQ